MSVFGKSLTRQEWNAAFFLGSEEGRFQGALAAQIRRGIQILSGTGYTFEVQALLESGGRLGDWPALPDEHERACREIARGDFDTSGRAREALQWLTDTAPEVDGTWLRGMGEGRSQAELQTQAEAASDPFGLVGKPGPHFSAACVEPPAAYGTPECEEGCAS